MKLNWAIWAVFLMLAVGVRAEQQQQQQPPLPQPEPVTWPALLGQCHAEKELEKNRSMAYEKRIRELEAKLKAETASK